MLQIVHPIAYTITFARFMISSWVIDKAFHQLHDKAFYQTNEASGWAHLWSMISHSEELSKVYVFVESNTNWGRGSEMHWKTVKTKEVPRKFGELAIWKRKNLFFFNIRVVAINPEVGERGWNPQSHVYELAFLHRSLCSSPPVSYFYITISHK